MEESDCGEKRCVWVGKPLEVSVLLVRFNGLYRDVIHIQFIDICFPNRCSL